MRALVTTADDGIALKTVDRPAPGPGQVSISVEVASINLADLMISKGLPYKALGFPTSQPMGTGWEIAGLVSELGADVSSLSVGQRVAVQLMAMRLPVAGHADEVVVDAADVAPIPDDLGSAEAATLPLNAISAYRAVDSIAGAQSGPVLVAGAAGTVGALVMATARNRGFEVDALARESDREFVEAQGARLVTEVEPGSYATVIDAAGLRDQALALTEDNGIFVNLMGLRPMESERGIDVKSTTAGPDREALIRAMDEAIEQKLPVRIAGTVSLDDYATGFAQMATPGRRGLWMITP